MLMVFYFTLLLLQQGLSAEAAAIAAGTSSHFLPRSFSLSFSLLPLPHLGFQSVRRSIPSLVTSRLSFVIDVECRVAENE